ncbi:K(+)-transporting ATPase subunit F [Siculibacillus lacustris]|uniref:K(+)-transporting ATPase subunit F n=1 Tax=Siculibacillus lacustris TaxID=1549641 RepID=A0A4Q9VYV0_9HYPH|nr:K(+)-transporting ATPase subunit F [Siculibacillus lacustris]TBW41364.1 K(+)-transporting ATPase subunit F [Siculibacillus lacustris]
MLAPATGCEATIMTEPIVALVIAVALGVYLLHTLLRPEKY